MPGSSTEARNRKTPRAPRSGARTRRAFHELGGRGRCPAWKKDSSERHLHPPPAAMTWQVRPWGVGPACESQLHAPKRVWEDVPEPAEGCGQARPEDGALWNWTQTRGRFPVSPRLAGLPRARERRCQVTPGKRAGGTARWQPRLWFVTTVAATLLKTDACEYLHMCTPGPVWPWGRKAVGKADGIKEPGIASSRLQC